MADPQTNGASDTPLPASGELPEKPLPYTPDSIEKFLIARVMERMGRQGYDVNRYQLERLWYENILFYLGMQWLDWSSQRAQFVPVKAPKWFPQPVTNEIFPRVERLTAMFLRNTPHARVRPNTNDPEDREAARGAEQLLAHIDDVVDDDALRHRLTLGFTLTGSICSHESFNPHTGPDVEIPETELTMDPQFDDVAACPQCGSRQPPEMAGEVCPTCGEGPLAPQRAPQVGPDGGFVSIPRRTPVLGADGEPVVHNFKMGEIESRVIYPFSFHCDPKVDYLPDAQWCGHESYQDLEWIKRTFPAIGHFVQEETPSLQSSTYQAALLQVVGQSQPQSWTGNTIALSHGATVLNYEEAESESFPDGLHVIVANGVCLYYGPLPIKGEFSYSICQYALMPGRLWGTGPVEQMVPLQRRLNAIDSQVIINRKTILNPWILAPKGSLKPGQVALRPAAVVEYSILGGGGVAPQIIPGQPLPASIQAEREAILNAMERISGTQDVMIGQVPPGVKSGVALHYLGEQAETTQAPRARRWELFIGERARKRLLLAQQHYHEPRTVKILGAGTEWTTRALRGADIRDNVDVTVEAGSALPRSRTAQIQLVFDSIQQGLLGDIAGNPILRQKILEEIGLMHFDTEIGADAKRANMENAQMDLGIVPMVDPLENSDVHYQIHLKEKKEPRFDDKTPQAKQAYEQHLMATRMKMLEEMMKEQGGTQPPGPMGPGGPGGPAQGPGGPAQAPGPQEAPTPAPGP